MKIKVTFLLALLIVGFIYVFATVQHDPIIGDASAKSTPQQQMERYQPTAHQEQFKNQERYAGGDDDIDEDPVIKDTEIPAQKQPTATLQLVNNNTAPTLTPTCTPGPNQDPNDDCDMCEQLSTVAAAQSTIAADVSKGD